ncbi:hypothetical protein HUT19_41535 (plasmid) [Streptomyces sp. NA02950]|uniref:DUF6011 domain-containing protein n=1 Tax=Streptomyces sp. NA02950 TaxID=2742137 RepID=UPI00159159A8|nr:DUF6011 domain-containing protein [Streptomyces sp. NA02950]QKV98207.1 hypothetical protein HUT19_41535 [Streptomyces sp. NA02950]
MTTQRDDQTSLPIPVTRDRPVVKCLDCKTPLTNRKSRLWGRGEKCRHDLTSAPSPGRFDVEQDELPDA